MASIDKTSLEHLAELARLELNPKEEEKLLNDLKKILDYFEELKSLDTSQIEPMNPHTKFGVEVNGDTSLENVFRDDEESERTNEGAGVNAFPETKDGFLKVPPVFES